MKVAAHPMVVAVALGLLSPASLEAVQERDDRRSPCSDCEGEALPPTATVAAVSPEVDDALVVELGEAPSALGVTAESPSDAAYWSDASAPSEAERVAVANAWAELTS